MIYRVSTENKINWRAKGRERIAQNVQNLLCTVRNEVAYKREKGRNASGVDSDPEAFKNLVIADTYEIIERYEQRAEIIDIKIMAINENGVSIEVVINVE